MKTTSLLKNQDVFKHAANHDDVCTSYSERYKIRELFNRYIPVYILLSYSSFCSKIDLLFRPLIFRNTSQSLQLIIETNLLNQIYQLVISKNHLQLGL